MHSGTKNMLPACKCAHSQLRRKLLPRRSITFRFIMHAFCTVSKFACIRPDKDLSDQLELCSPIQGRQVKRVQHWISAGHVANRLLWRYWNVPLAIKGGLLTLAGASCLSGVILRHSLDLACKQGSQTGQGQGSHPSNQ